MLKKRQAYCSNSYYTGAYKREKACCKLKHSTQQCGNNRLCRATTNEQNEYELHGYCTERMFQADPTLCHEVPPPDCGPTTFVRTSTGAHYGEKDAIKAEEQRKIEQQKNENNRETEHFKSFRQQTVSLKIDNVINMGDFRGKSKFEDLGKKAKFQETKATYGDPLNIATDENWQVKQVYDVMKKNFAKDGRWSSLLKPYERKKFGQKPIPEETQFPRLKRWIARRGGQDPAGGHWRAFKKNVNHLDYIWTDNHYKNHALGESRKGVYENLKHMLEFIALWETSPTLKSMTEWDDIVGSFYRDPKHKSSIQCWSGSEDNDRRTMKYSAAMMLTMVDGIMDFVETK